MTDQLSLQVETASGPTFPYRSRILVRFAHCDPAGIVFYPRYMEMLNNLVEDWCAEGLQLPFAELHQRLGWGLPIVHLEVDFVAPSFLGEILSAALSVRKTGTSSIQLEVILAGPDGDDRVRAILTLVLIDLKTKRSFPLPEHLRAQVAGFMDRSTQIESTK